MKIKEIQGFPNEKKYPIGVFSEAEQGEVEGYNECLQEIGDMEIEIDVDKVRDILYKYSEFKGWCHSAIADKLANSKSILKWRSV